MAGSVVLEKGTVAKALFDYEAENGDELTLAVGDIITDLATEQDHGWLKGTLKGKRGAFPDNFIVLINDHPVAAVAAVAAAAAPVSSAAADAAVRSAPAVAPVLSAPAKEGPGRAAPPFVRVLFAYEAEAEDELAMEVDEIIEIEGEAEEGWLRGIKQNGRKGVLPDAFVKNISAEEAAAALAGKPGSSNPTSKPPASSAASSKKAITPTGFAPVLPNTAGRKVLMKARVAFTYEQQADDELSLKEGEIVEVLSTDVSAGWWEGQVNGKVGVFPDNFVTAIEEQPEPPPEVKQAPVQPPKPSGPQLPARPKPLSKTKPAPPKPAGKRPHKSPEIKRPHKSPEVKKSGKSPEEKRNFLPKRPSLTKLRAGSTPSKAPEPDLDSLDLELSSKPLTHVTHNRAGGRAGRRLPTRFANRASMPPTIGERHTPVRSAPAKTEPAPSALSGGAGHSVSLWNRPTTHPPLSATRSGEKNATASFSRLQTDLVNAQTRMAELEKKWRSEMKRLSAKLREERELRMTAEAELNQIRKSQPRLRLT